jgi:cbb3-type cytochrome oxidase subunit 3
MRLFKIILLIIFITILTYAFYNFKKNNSNLEKKYYLHLEEAEKIKKENQELKNKIEYLKIKENLLKELKKQYNYKESEENLIIIIPKNATNTRP